MIDSVLLCCKFIGPYSRGIGALLQYRAGVSAALAFRNAFSCFFFVRAVCLLLLLLFKL